MARRSCDAANNLRSINDDGALRGKVDEAMRVYDEYVKNRADVDDGGKDGATKDGEAAESKA